MELVGAGDGAGRRQQVQRRALRGLGGLHHGLVLGAVLVGLEEDAVQLFAHRCGATAGSEFPGPGIDLRGDLLLALDGGQRGLHRLFGRLLEQPLAEAAEVVRRVEQAQQHRRLLFGAGGGAEVVARQIGEVEVAFGRKLPGQVQFDFACRGQRAGQQRCGRGLVETQHHVGRLDLHALARVELDLQRGLGLGHHAAGVELARIVEKHVHQFKTQSRRSRSSGVASSCGMPLSKVSRRAPWRAAVARR